MIPKLLFVNQKQFGYHINYVQYCKFLKSDYNITYLCWDYGKNKINEENIEIIYISRHGNILQRNIRFINAVINLIKKHLHFIVFINYFKGCFVIPLLCGRKQHFHLNIVTGSISTHEKKRFIFNLLIHFESIFFSSVSTLSEGLKKYLRLPDSTFITPLGAVSENIVRQKDHRVHMLFVGSFAGRNLHETIIGLNLFLKEHPGADICYTIIGQGWGDELLKIRQLTSELGLDKFLNIKGYIPHSELKQYFEKSNVGITYIPIKPWFNFQPSTKIFEYLMAGMPVIATATYENKKVINDQNGLIIFDTPQDFAKALELLYERIDDYDEYLIRESVNEYKWENIVNKLGKYISDRT